VLNALHIQPEILTMKSHIEENKIRKNYGIDVDFKLRILPFEFRMPVEWHILYFNLRVRKYLTEYDLVVNSNNTAFLLPGKNRILDYIHYPRKTRNRSKERSIELPQGPGKSRRGYQRDLLGVAANLYRFDRLENKNIRLLANSEFTKQAVIEAYSLNQSMVEVVYPPVMIDSDTRFKNRIPNLVVSLGRFAPEKRQLEQIKIAEKLPEFTFFIIGFSRPGNDYFEKCQKYVNQNEIKNINLEPNLSFEKMEERLLQATYFLHSNRNEPFGITTVQAIAKDCLPIVHDSGGQKEVVPFQELRYKSETDAIEKFKRLRDPSRNNWIASTKFLLNENIQQYSVETFNEKMRRILLEEIG